MKKGLTRLLLVMIALTLIVSTIPAYEPHAEQNVPPVETPEQGTPEKTEVVEEQGQTENEVPAVVTTVEEAEAPSVKVDGDWKDPYYDTVRRSRSVAPEKPEKATIKTASNGVGTGTGAMNLSWKAMPGATGYKVIIGNGYNYEYFSVGNVTSWTTKGKGIFPTKAELDKGLYRFHTDGKGTEFANDPTQLYENTFKAGTTWTLRGQKKYIVRILAIYSSGDGPTSDIAEAIMPPETLPEKPEKATIKTVSNGAGTGTGYMDISWQAVSGAINYKVVIGNGYNYEYFNTGNVTSWSTKGKKIFPTQAEIANKQYKFHQDGKGVEFASDPRALYENGYQAGSTFGLRNQEKYIVRILAVYPWGDGVTSDIANAYMPPETSPAKPEKSIIKTASSGAGTGTGYMDVSWQAVPGAVDYKVVIGNGYNYEYFNTGNVTNWSTKGKKIFPTQEELDNGQYKFHADGKGAEFANDPRILYENGYEAGSTFGLRNQEKYIIRILAVYPWGDGIASDITDARMPLETPYSPSGYVYSNGMSSGSGYVNLKWKSVDNADGYRISIFDGRKNNFFDVGNVTSWTSKDKGIWPKQEDISRGAWDVHLDGQGTELAVDPSIVYKNSGGVYGERKNYWFRVQAYSNNPLYAESSISDVYTPTITPSDVKELNAVDVRPFGIDDVSGYIDFSWEATDKASGYKVGIFDGSEYKYFDVGNQTNWTTKDMGIWPTDDEIEKGLLQLHSDAKGTNLSKYPGMLFMNKNNKYDDSYKIKIIAYDATNEVVAYSEVDDILITGDADVSELDKENFEVENDTVESFEEYLVDDIGDLDGQQITPFFVPVAIVVGVVIRLVAQWVGKKAVKTITKHAIKRAAERGISSTAFAKAMAHGTKYIDKNTGAKILYDAKSKVTLVLDKAGKVVTTTYKQNSPKKVWKKSNW